MWLKEEGFKDLIKAWWQSFEAKGSDNYILLEKLKGLKVFLKNWNKKVSRRVELHKQDALKRLNYWGLIENNRPLSPLELDLQLKVVEDFKKWALLEETSWRQKTREL